MSKPVLWHFAISHYNEKVRWALDWKEIEHKKKLRYVEYPLVNTLRTRQMQTPILFHRGRTLVDSTNIIAYLEKAFPEKPLYPADAADRQKALELEDFFDEELGPHIRALVVNELFKGGGRLPSRLFQWGRTQFLQA